MTDDSRDLESDQLPEHLAVLDDSLSVLGEDVMMLSALDGLLAAVSACPETIPPEEWLSLIWLDEAVDEEALLANPEVGEVVARILTHQQDIAAALEAGGGAFTPIYNVSDATDETLWEIWIEGFQRGLSLRVDAWEALYQRDADAADAFELITTLILLAEGHAETKADLGAKQEEELTAAAPDVIPECVEVLYRAAHPRQPVRSSKIGRNDPCPCGSGKKHKKCCGAA